MAPYFHALFSVLLLSVLAETKPVVPQILTWKDTRFLVSFGDSFTYVQGTRGRTNYSFIGDNVDPAFTVHELLSNYIVQNQTATAEGGPNYVEFLTGCGLKSTYTLPRTCERQLWNFAFAGADVSEKFLTLHHNFTIDFDKQIEQYALYGHDTISYNNHPKFLASALVLVWIGINDINDSAKFTNVSFPEFYANITKTIFQSLETMYELGYHQYVILNLPPYDRTPSNANAVVKYPNSTQINWWNAALEHSSNYFASTHQKAVVRFFDANTVLNNILDNPADYGIKNVTGYCPNQTAPDIASNYAAYGCLPLDEYFWFNSGHMTSHTHKVFTPYLKSFLEKPKLYGSS